MTSYQIVAAATDWNIQSWRRWEWPSLPADRFIWFCLLEPFGGGGLGGGREEGRGEVGGVGGGKMTVEFANVAEVWHYFKADVVTFCSRSLAWADDSALLNGNTLVFLS